MSNKITMLDNINPDSDNRFEIAALELFSLPGFHKTSPRNTTNSTDTSFTFPFKHLDSIEKTLSIGLLYMMGLFTDRMENIRAKSTALKGNFTEVFWFPSYFPEWCKEIAKIFLPQDNKDPVDVEAQQAPHWEQISMGEVNENQHDYIQVSIAK